VYELGFPAFVEALAEPTRSSEQRDVFFHNKNANQRKEKFGYLAGKI
jgi:hypothetical protein